MTQFPTIADEFMEAINRNSIEDVGALLAAGKDINARNERGITPLMWAANNDAPKIAELLVAKGADLDAQDNNKFTALMFAARFGHREIAGMLGLAGARLDLRDSSGRTAENIADFIDDANNFPHVIGPMLRGIPERRRQAKEEARKKAERELERKVAGCTVLKRRIKVGPALRLKNPRS